MATCGTLQTNRLRKMNRIFALLPYLLWVASCMALSRLLIVLRCRRSMCERRAFTFDLQMCWREPNQQSHTVTLKLVAWIIAGATYCRAGHAIASGHGWAKLRRISSSSIHVTIIYIYYFVNERANTQTTQRRRNEKQRKTFLYSIFCGVSNINLTIVFIYPPDRTMHDARTLCL